MAVLCLGVYFGLHAVWAMALVALKYVNPPTTGVQIQRRVESWFPQTRWRKMPYQKRMEFVPLDKISIDLQHAVIASEDGNYYKHHGVDWTQVAVRLRNSLDDAKHQIEHHIYGADEMAVRFHHQLVWIHPFPNGNGRHARLMADILVMRLGQPRLTWGGGEATLVAQGWIRQQYLAALRAADQGQFSDLIAFARS